MMAIILLNDVWGRDLLGSALQRASQDVIKRYPFYFSNGRRKLFIESDLANIVAALREEIASHRVKLVRAYSRNSCSGIQRFRRWKHVDRGAKMSGRTTATRVFGHWKEEDKMSAASQGSLSATRLPSRGYGRGENRCSLMRITPTYLRAYRRICNRTFRKRKTLDSGLESRVCLVAGPGFEPGTFRL